ncbi:MAG TPA: tRNA uridine-5-carboxymethylaminomethyl(34) synthesis GTPase MnmE [Vicinamibacterales bacterium]|nr:tRNA uridine-5-carboxymethylaminomethyl(34) synthesis GTPase MnmE [Vicinamibacterales bacterium]
MFSTDDTIAAIATPPGRGAIGVVRISGPDAPAIAAAVLDRRKPLEPRRATFARISGARGAAAGAAWHLASDRAFDHVVATYFPAPHSYTGQHVVEISAHGSPVVLDAIVRAALDAGARLAQPGEFTLRAFLSGKLDLVQAEAVGDLIAAATPLQARVAFDQLEGTLTRRIAAIDEALFDLIARLEASLDFPDEGYHFVEPGEIAARIAAVVAEVDELLGDAARGRMIREGATVVIAGRPNVGKSSVFNALVGHDRAIVTDVPGTTRDLVTERVDIEGLAVTLVDTAGDRDTLDVVEREGVARGSRARDVADLVLLVVDRSDRLTPDDERLLAQTSGLRRIVVLNKSDRPPVVEVERTGLRPGTRTLNSLASARLAAERAAAGSRSAAGAGGAQVATAVMAGPAETLLEVSARTGAGMADLRRAIAAALSGGEARRDTAAISNLRHIALLEEARADLARAQQAAAGTTPEEFLLADLQAARLRFDEIVGTRTSEDVLRRIFERFCIGK